MATEYVQDERLDEAVNNIMSSLDYPEFAPLRDAQVVVLPVLCVKLDAEGEPVEASGAPVKIKKLGQAERVYIKGHYLLVMGYKEWNSFNDVQVSAVIHSALMGIRVEQKDGAVRLKTKKPDVVLHNATVARFGAFDASVAGFKEALANIGLKSVETVIRAVDRHLEERQAA